jgi:tetratricopeptide (TPR) repeat protein
MAEGSDGDDDELVEIELEELPGEALEPPRAPASGPPVPPVRSSPPSVPADSARPPRPIVPPAAAEPGAEGEVELGDIVEVRQPIMEAAETDTQADRKLFESEAEAATEPSRRAVLLLEIARLVEAEGNREGTLAATRQAFSADPSLPVTLWSLRRLLSDAGLWRELADAYRTAAQAVTPTGRSAPEARSATVLLTDGREPALRAGAAGAGEARAARTRSDLAVERGRLLEDRLQRDGEAIASYEEALLASPDHVGAMLALLLAGARRQEAAIVAKALAGLARRADGSRRAALAIEEARAWRQHAEGGERAHGAERALAVLIAELERADVALPLGTVLGELDALTVPDVPPDVAVRALAEIARRVAAVDRELAVALWRERARLQSLRLATPADALASLEEAARLDPAHPLVAADRLQLVEAQGSGAGADALALELIAQAASDDEAVDLALLHAELALRAGRDAAAAASLQQPRVRERLSARADLRALGLVVAIRARDATALHDGFLAEAEHAAGKGVGEAASIADALVAGAAIRQWRLKDLPGAEALYRRALDKQQTNAPATHALVDMLVSAGRGAEAAALLEKTLTWAADVSTMFEVWAREKIVSIYADELGQPERAAEHQRRLVELTPKDVQRRVRLADIDLCRAAPADIPKQVDNLMALADLAGDPAVAIALKVEAGRTLIAGPTPELRKRGETLLADLVTQDASGLAASGLENKLPTAAARADLVINEISAAEDAPVEAVRALRFRLAHHYEADGRFAEALAALTPLRSDDAMARAWSYELARRSGEAVLEVAVLSEEARASDNVLGDETSVRFAYGEALARVGDPSGAAEAFRQAIASAGAGPTAVDAALALLRIAATDMRAGTPALADALRGLSAACAEDAALAEGAAREAALLGVVADRADPADAAAPAPLEAAPRVRADKAVLRLLSAARIDDAGALGEALLDMAALAGQDSAGSLADSDPAWKADLLARAVARARLGGAGAVQAVARRAWETAHSPALASALSDLPLATGGAWPDGRPDTRRARARRTGGPFATALDLEAALDAERRGALGTALAIYGSVVGIDPERLEAWTGIRRVARAGGDMIGEARALARLGAVVRDPGEASALLAEAAGVYERAGRIDDAITALAKCVELRPNDSKAYMRAYQLLRADLDAPGRALLFDALLSHRLAAAPLSPAARVALLFERGQHRLQKVVDHAAASADFKEILKIQPEHREALYQLAHAASEDRDPESAAHWLVQFLAVASDDARAPEARLDLATCYEALKDRARAVETLRRASSMRPGDPKPLHRLSDLYLRQGEWKGAVEALRASEARIPDSADRAALHLRIGAVLRDLGRDAPAAAAAFRRAAELDPLGDGTRALVALHDAAGDPRGALDTVDHEVADVRRALAADPLDVRRLERLAELLEMARSRGSNAPIAEAEAAVASVIDLVSGQATPSAPVGRPRPFAPKAARAFWAELAHPAAGGFAGELWPNLVEAATELFPAPAARGKRQPIPPGAAQQLAWIETSATALGIAGLHIQVAREGGAAQVAALEEPGPVLLLGADPDNSLAMRFHVGRALGILAQRATLLERVRPEELAPVFACAAIIAGVAPPAGLPKPSEELLRAVTRAVGRKQRKALTLQASRFPFEKLDLVAWHEGVLRTADRVGLMLAGDVAASALALAGAASRAVSAAQVATNPAALDLLRFALGEQYPSLRKGVG